MSNRGVDPFSKENNRVPPDQWETDKNTRACIAELNSVDTARIFCQHALHLLAKLKVPVIRSTVPRYVHSFLQVDVASEDDACRMSIESTSRHLDVLHRKQRNAHAALEGPVDVRKWKRPKRTHER